MALLTRKTATSRADAMDGQGVKPATKRPSPRELASERTWVVKKPVKVLHNSVVTDMPFRAGTRVV